MSSFASAAVASVPGTPLDLIGYRNQAPGFDPRSGEGARRAGGRFNPPHSFPVVYLCTTRPCAVAELTRQARRQGLEPAAFLPRELWCVTGALTNVLDLTADPNLTSLSLDSVDLVRDDLELTRAIGEAAHEHGYQAIRSPSATDVNDIVAVLTENLAGAVLNNELLETWTTPADLE